MPDHKFHIGETVELSPSVTRSASRDVYEVTKQLPDSSVGEHEYRIKSINEPHERVVRESELSKAPKVFRIKVLGSFSVPRRSKKALRAASPQTAAFRQRYEEIEKRRAKLVERLSALREPARSHPAYKNVLKLTNNIFRKSSLLERIAVLQAAAWLIDILERL